MVLEREILTFTQWLLGGENLPLGALPRFVITIGVAALLALLVGFLIALVRYGPLKAGDLVYKTLRTGARELRELSLRRIWAIARLSIQESIRRRVVVALVLFAIILLFASWFLKTDYQEPAKLYLSFVLTASTYLLLLVALLLSAFSLPNEFKTKTIYTIVTKPVRAGDIVLGRILGFTLVGTAFLLVMAAGSYIFVVRSLSHTHEVEMDSLRDVVVGGEVVGKSGRTTNNDFHRHDVTIYEDGYGTALSAHSHEHSITPLDAAAGTTYVVAPPQEIMRARVPHRGTLHFLSKQGVREERGVNVGNEWAYRSFIAGATAAAAIWTFDGIDESKLRTNPDDGSQVLPVELIVRVFRTHKGDIEQGILGSIQLVNPDDPSKRSAPQTFFAKDYAIDSREFPRKLYDAEQEPIDLLDDLVTSDGRIQVKVQCLMSNQYFGFAQADCYIQLPEVSPLWNYCKAQIGIWVQMLLVIAIGVTCSTFLNGPIAMMFTVCFILLGFFRQFFVKVASGDQPGGGPVESLVRLYNQSNVTTPLEEGLGTSILKGIDSVLQTMMLSLAYLLPDFRSFSSVDYVAYGFNIPAEFVAQHVTAGLAFVLGLSLVGYFCLRMREVAK